jgi:hypothetical protein
MKRLKTRFETVPLADVLKKVAEENDGRTRKTSKELGRQRLRCWHTVRERYDN